MSSNMLLNPPPYTVLLLCLFVLASIFHPSDGDIATAARYSGPFLPTACYGNSQEQILSSRLFGAAGEGIWDDGASCGRRYEVRCINGAVPGTCFPDKTILIRIIDRAETSRSRPSSNGTVIVLSNAAFGTIANASAKSIGIEFIEY